MATVSILDNMQKKHINWAVMYPSAPYLFFLICLMPDGFTCQGGSSAALMG
jgi:hypothetical protein